MWLYKNVDGVYLTSINRFVLLFFCLFVFHLNVPPILLGDGRVSI